MDARKFRSSVTLRNDFHGSEVRIRVPRDFGRVGDYELTPNQSDRVQEVLCGVSGCECGPIRGPQEVNWYPDAVSDGPQMGHHTWVICALDAGEATGGVI